MGGGPRRAPPARWQGGPSASGLRLKSFCVLRPGSPWQPGLEEGLAGGLDVSDTHLFGSDLHISEATQRVLSPVVEAQVAIGDLRKCFLEGSMKFPAPLST